jgi:hypothetical protein
MIINLERGLLFVTLKIMLKYVQCDHTAHYSIIYWDIPSIII